MQTTLYHKMELATGMIILCSVPVFFSKYPDPYSLSLADIFKWAGILLLGQGLLRDLVFITFYRKLLQQKKQTDTTEDALKTSPKKGIWLCLESTLGILLISLFFLQNFAKSQTVIEFATGYWVLALSFWWLFGYFTREFVLELKRDPNHMNLIIGF